MNEPKKCEICGAEIPEDAPGGACPGCLLGAGLDEPEPAPEPFEREELTRIFPQFEVEARSNAVHHAHLDRELIAAMRVSVNKPRGHDIAGGINDFFSK